MGAISHDDRLRLARMEAVYNHTRNELLDVMRETYAAAVEEEDAKEAARIARKIRDKLLDETDKEMMFDRIDLDVSSVTSFIASVAGIMTNAWGKYRQHLRDIPNQEGFPFTIDWGEKPED